VIRRSCRSLRDAIESNLATKKYIADALFLSGSWASCRFPHYRLKPPLQPREYRHKLYIARNYSHGACYSAELIVFKILSYKKLPTCNFSSTRDPQSFRGSEIFCASLSASDPSAHLCCSRDTAKYSINRLYGENFKYVKLLLNIAVRNGEKIN